MRGILCALLTVCMCCTIALPAAAASIGDASQGPAQGPVLPAQPSAQTPAQIEAFAAFERFTSFQLERGAQAAPPRLGETVTADADASVFVPFDGFVLKAFSNDDEHKERPMYLCGSARNDSFEENVLWTILQDCMRAIEPALTEDVSRELMQELLFDMGPVSEDLPGVDLGAVFYGHWRFSLTTLENGEEGPMFTALPVQPQEEPEGTSNARLAAVYRRFRLTTEWLGLAMTEDTPGEWDHSDPTGKQYNRVIAPGAWWMELYFGDVFAGCGISLQPDSPLYGHLPDLFFALAVAVDPSQEPDEYNAMYEDLLARTEESPNGNINRLLCNGIQYQLLHAGEQLGLLAMRQSIFDDQPQDVRANARNASTAHNRFRQACEDAGYDLLPEESPRVEDDTWYVWNPLPDLEWGISLDEDSRLLFYVSAETGTISFDDAMPLFFLAARVIDPDWPPEEAKAFLDDLRANLREDGDNLVCVNDREGIVYVLMDQGGAYVSLTMMVTP